MSVRSAFFWFFVIGSVVFPIIGYNMGQKRTIGPIRSALLGLVFGFAGLLIILLFPTLEEEQSQSASAADELLKYKKILDMGGITQQEYDMKKAELLRR